MSHRRVDSAYEDDPQPYGFHTGIMDKARDARDAWKRFQRDARQEKLKQSIRVLGPTDPAVVSGYVRSES